MSGFLLTSSFCWVYACFAFNKLKAGFDSLLHKRIPPLSGFFVSEILFALLFFWVGILGSLRARWSCVQSVNLTYPPARVSHGWRLSTVKQKERKS